MANNFQIGSEFTNNYYHYKVVDSMPRKYSDKLIVISCFDDTNLCKNLHALEVPVVSSEFVMTGVLRHVVDPLE